MKCIFLKCEFKTKQSIMIVEYIFQQIWLLYIFFNIMSLHYVIILVYFHFFMSLFSNKDKINFRNEISKFPVQCYYIDKLGNQSIYCMYGNDKTFVSYLEFSYNVVFLCIPYYI